MPAGVSGSACRPWPTGTCLRARSGNRLLDPVYPVVCLNAPQVKTRDEGLVRNKAVDVALAITGEGGMAILGLWIEQTEGARFRIESLPPIRISATYLIQINIGAEIDQYAGAQ